MRQRRPHAGTDFERQFGRSEERHMFRNVAGDRRELAGRQVLAVAFLYVPQLITISDQAWL